MILTPQEPWYVAACTSAIAIASKYAARTRSANIFNPAALALVATFYIFNTGQSWSRVLPEISPYALIVLVATGAFIADRVNKIPLVLIFLFTYFGLFTLTSFVGDPGKVAEMFRAPDLHAVLFFAFFILTDPPTSPVRYPDQIVCGVLVALASYATFEWVGAAHYLLAGVLVGNIWEAWHRTHNFYAGACRRRPHSGTAPGREAKRSLRKSDPAPADSYTRPQQDRNHGHYFAPNGAQLSFLAHGHFALNGKGKDDRQKQRRHLHPEGEA